MTKRLLRDFGLAVGVFLFVALLMYTNAEFTAPITEYVQFVVSTDFTLQPLLQKMGVWQQLADWDLGTFFQEWTPISRW